jgi:hypothetical protein
VFLAHLETTDATRATADFERRPPFRLANHQTAAYRRLGRDGTSCVRREHRRRARHEIPKLLLGRTVFGLVHRSHLGVPRRRVLQAVATTQVDVEPFPPCNTSSSSTETAPEHVIAAFRSPCRNAYGRQPRHVKTSSIRPWHQAFQPPLAVRIVHSPVRILHMLGLTRTPCHR